MTKIDADGLVYRELNQMIRQAGDDITVENCCGQRYIGSGMRQKHICINGVAGNALGAYLDGAEITVNGNAQDAVGDTMNDGKIVIHGHAGDAVGYAMRGGEIYVRGNVGYRAGVHMKEYGEKFPVLVAGGSCGSFLGEYQAGGIIIILDLEGKTLQTCNFPGTGMHGGKIILRGDCSGLNVPEQVKKLQATEKDMQSALPYIRNYCRYFGVAYEKILQEQFYVLTPNSSNPYKKMYVQN